MSVTVVVDVVVVVLHDFLVQVYSVVRQVIQRYCHGRSSSTGQQEELEDLHLSLPISMEAVSDNWDSAVQVSVWGRWEIT